MVFSSIKLKSPWIPFLSTIPARLAMNRVQIFYFGGIGKAVVSPKLCLLRTLYIPFGYNVCRSKSYSDMIRLKSQFASVHIIIFAKVADDIRNGSKSKRYGTLMKRPDARKNTSERKILKILH